MIETALVFDKHGRPLHWHLPPGRSAGYLPDSTTLWDVLWEHREYLGGVAHTHPWSGATGPSSTDLTTFDAVERGLGVRLVWPIVTFTHIVYLAWQGPGRLEYEEATVRRFRLRRADIDELRELSMGGETCQTIRAQSST